jgi:Transketolase, N-terminal subunit
MDYSAMKAFAREVRVNVVNAIGSIGSGHIGGCLSIAEVLAVLYTKQLRADPKNPRKEGRDRLICSKGHAGPAVYSALAEAGYFDKKELLTLNQGGTHLPSHCDMNKVTGIDFTAGSLGQGFGAAVGMAIGSKLKGDGARIYVIVGDGESQEGSIWEGAMYAANKKLDNLIALLDNNKLQLDGETAEINCVEPIEDKWKAFGWRVLKADGHDVEDIDKAIEKAKKAEGKPTVIILNTVKGKGISFVEAAKVSCHSMSLTREQCDKALEELRGEV